MYKKRGNEKRGAFKCVAMWYIDMYVMLAHDVECVCKDTSLIGLLTLLVGGQNGRKANKLSDIVSDLDPNGCKYW